MSGPVTVDFERLTAYVKAICDLTWWLGFFVACNYFFCIAACVLSIRSDHFRKAGYSITALVCLAFGVTAYVATKSIKKAIAKRQLVYRPKQVSR